MSSKPAAVIIVWVALLGGLLGSQEPSELDPLPVAQPPVQFPGTDVSPDELQKLQAALGLPPQFRSLISPTPIPVPQLLEAIPPEKMSLLNPSERLTSQKLLVRAFQNLGSSSSDLVKDVPHYLCPAFSEADSQRLSNLSVLQFEQIARLLGDFIRLYAQWYKGIPRRFKQGTLELTATPEERQAVLKNAESVFGEFSRFSESFQSQHALIEDTLKNYQCNIKDFLTFYDALFRFYSVYTVVPHTTTRDVRLTELTLAWVKWQNRFMEVVDVLRLYRLLVFEFGEYLEHTRAHPDSSLGLPFQHINIRMLGQLTSKYKRLTKGNERFIFYFRVLRKTIAGLEHSMKWDLPPLPYPKSAWLAGAAVSLLLILGLI